MLERFMVRALLERQTGAFSRMGVDFRSQPYSSCRDRKRRAGELRGRRPGSRCGGQMRLRGASCYRLLVGFNPITLPHSVNEKQSAQIPAVNCSH